jgi:ATP-dependent helicase HrpA
MTQPQGDLPRNKPFTIQFPESLPITEKASEIIAAIKAHQVIIVAGETGSGKTTQIPKMCLEAGVGVKGQIGCTQPRRIAALSVSRRLAEELSATWGEDVGCKIRFSDKTKRHTRIKVMTDGILLAETRSDPSLSAYEALIIDEAHERSLNIDFLLGYLKQLVTRRPDLKLIITSATIDTELFSKAFGGAPIFEVSGRLYPVEVRYRPLVIEEESDELSYVDGALQAVDEVMGESYDGDVLVFMPTERDIRDVCDRLVGRFAGRVEVLPLMGSLSAGEQERVFRCGEKRKVIVATNIAETSLTIPRIRYVIDAGLARISRYSGRQRTKRLPIEKVAKSSAHQRAGRAGRVREGVCVRLYDELDYKERQEFTDPEILRANLAEVILRMTAFGLGDIETFPFLNPPDGRAVRSGFALLHELGALEASNSLTPLGRELAKLPVDPTIGRILLQARREHCLPEALVIAAGLSIQDPRERPVDKREKAEVAHRAFQHPDSDYLTLLNIWLAYNSEWQEKKSQNQMRKFCKTHFLSYMRMREWTDLLGELREVMGAKPGDIASASEIKRFDGRYRSIHRAILSGLIGQVAFRTDQNTYRGPAGRVVSIFPGSALSEKQNRRNGPQKTGGKNVRSADKEQWIVSAEVVETSRLFARMVARVQVQWLEELGRHLCKRVVDEPQWSDSRGEVVAKERITLYGLVLANRRINYSRYNPTEATEIFVRNMLVGESSSCEAPFVSKNRKLADKIAMQLAQVGRLDRLALEEQLVSFYAERLPGISSLRDFERYTKTALANDPERFDLKVADLSAEKIVTDDTEAFPNSLEIGGATIDLHYRYQPGGAQDGVTMALPLALAKRIPARMLDGAIPGLREKQITYLISSLPKEFRKPIQSIPGVVIAIADHKLMQERPLLEAFVTVLRDSYKITLPAGAASLDSLPEHLRPRIELIADSGVIASGRDLSNLLNEVSVGVADTNSTHLGVWGEVRRTWEKESVTPSEFEDLPQSIEVGKISGVPVYLYPALVREEERVALRLLESKDAALAESYDGIRELARIALAKEVQELRKQTKDVDILKPLLTLYCTPDHIKAEVLTAALVHMFEGESPYPLTRRDFEQMLVTARGRMPGLVSTLIGWVKTSLELRRNLIALKRPYPGMREELDELLPIDFVSRTPYDCLRHLPRYLKGMLLRSERADNDPKRYQERAQQLARYVALLRSNSPGLPAGFRWMVEEFKVSLFAQELGTQYPISANRLDKALSSER